MASQEIKDHIKSKMDGWDGTPDKLPKSTGGWEGDMYEWGRRVRRDILVLEKLLVDNKVINKADLYGDPGDPPPPPDI